MISHPCCVISRAGKKKQNYYSNTRQGNKCAESRFSDKKSRSALFISVEAHNKTARKIKGVYVFVYER